MTHFGETETDPRPRCSRCGEVAPLDTAVIDVRGLVCGDCDYRVASEAGEEAVRP